MAELSIESISCPDKKVLLCLVLQTPDSDYILNISDADPSLLVCL